MPESFLLLKASWITPGDDSLDAGESGVAKESLVPFLVSGELEVDDEEEVECWDADVATVGWWCRSRLRASFTFRRNVSKDMTGGAPRPR